MQKLTATLIKSTKQSPDTTLYEFALEPDALSIKPGQYVTLNIIAPDGKQKYNRAYSVAGFGEDAVLDGLFVKTKIIKLLIRTVPNGKASSVLQGFEVGVSLPIYGASGLLTPPADLSSPLLLCGSATGIAPYFSFLQYFDLAKIYPDINLYFGLKHLDDLYMLEELEKCQSKWQSNNSKFEIRVCISQEKDEVLTKHKYARFLKSGRMTKHIAQDVPGFSGWAYICGGKDFVLGMTEFITKSLPQKKIVVEKFF